MNQNIKYFDKQNLIKEKKLKKFLSKLKIQKILIKHVFDFKRFEIVPKCIALPASLTN